jgi:hypothetical protein
MRKVAKVNRDGMRAALRRKKIGLAHGARPHARIPSGAKLTPASLYTLVYIRQTKVDEHGNERTVNVIVPRSMMEDKRDQQ